MNKLTAKQLLMINRKLVGEDVADSDESLKILEEIAKIPYEQDERFFYIYKNTVAKAAKLGCAIARIKPFRKKNNQSAVFSLLTLLELNKIKLVDYENDLATLVSLLEAGDVEKTGKWIEKYQIQGDLTEQV